MGKTFQLKGTDYQFTPTGGPIDNPEQYSTLLQAIGLALASWSRMEQMLLNLTIHTNKKELSKVLHKSNPSHNVVELTKLLEKWLSEYPRYQAFIPDENFFSYLREEMTLMRILLAHGYVESYDPDNKVFTIKIVSKKGKDNWKYLSVDYSLDTLDMFTKEINQAHHYFIAIAEHIFSHFD